MKKVDCTAYAVIYGNILSSKYGEIDTEFPTKIQIEGRTIELNARPPLAIYDTEKAAFEKARRIGSFNEPCRVVKVTIKEEIR